MKIREIISEIKIGQSNPAYTAAKGSVPTIPKSPSIPSLPTAKKPSANSGSTTLGNKSPGSSTLSTPMGGSTTLGTQSPGAATIPRTQTAPSSTNQSIAPVEPSDLGDTEPDLYSGPVGVMGGIKAGLGMNPQQSFTQGLVTKALQAAGMSNTAATLNPNQIQQPIGTVGGRFDPVTKSQYKVGGTIKHPKLGDLKIDKVTDYGVTVSSPTLGHRIRIAPQDLATLQSRRK